MSELTNDAFIIVSDNHFRIRVDGYLRGLGVYQIIGTKEYLEIEFVGGEFSVRIGYPNKIEELSEIIKKRLLDETEFMPQEINTISYFVNEYVDEIESFLRMT